MRAKSLSVVVIFAAVVLVLPGSAPADTMITASFNDGMFGPNLTNQGGNQVINGAVYTAAADYTQRNFVVTNDSDYATSTWNWTLTLNVDNSNTTSPNYVRVGIGTGAPSGLWGGEWPPNGWFNEPSNALYLDMDMNTNIENKPVDLYYGPANGFATELANLQQYVPQIGTAEIKKVGGNLIFGWDQGSTGTFVTTSVAIADYPMLTAAGGSKLFFSVYEGNATSSVDNFSMVPEPSTLGLLITGLTGLLAYGWRKRR